MRFPEPARDGSAAHVDAVRRLDVAREQQCEKRDALDAARHTEGERAAATELAAASQNAAAREAWLVWVERGY
jgi:hypothetical protein